jgi:hypothetical protein
LPSALAQEAPPDLAGALNNPGWTFGVSTRPGVIRPWVPDALVTRDGQFAVRSGSIDHGQASGFSTVLQGPGTLRFWWKVSSEANYDWLNLYIDGVLAGRISGPQDWALVEFPIPAGRHVVD